MSGSCPKCGYKLSKFAIASRCFNCDYQERGSDGPWADGVADQSLIYQAESIWNDAYPLSTQDYTLTDYLTRRGIIDLALTCDQLRLGRLVHRAVPIRMGTTLLARIWHVRRGFVGVHATLIEALNDNERRTCGSCRGGAVWFGAVSPTTELVVGEGIETTLSAMILWGLPAGAATLGTAGLESLVLPQAARRVVIAADNDWPVPPKKIGKGLSAARAARLALLDEDPRISVRIEMPSKVGADWNDVLLESCHG
jgi:hypothetical protein